MGRILIADDEEHILSVMIDVLEDAGHQVVGVRDGAEALEELQDGVFDIAIIDVMMPKMDGYHLAAKIHGLHRPPQIVIATSRNFNKDAQLVQGMGVAAFLPKPFANKELLEVVSTLLKRS